MPLAAMAHPSRSASDRLDQVADTRKSLPLFAQLKRMKAASRYRKPKKSAMSTDFARKL